MINLQGVYPNSVLNVIFNDDLMGSEFNNTDTFSVKVEVQELNANDYVELDMSSYTRLIDDVPSTTNQYSIKDNQGRDEFYLSPPTGQWKEGSKGKVTISGLIDDVGNTALNDKMMFTFEVIGKAAAVIQTPSTPHFLPLSDAGKFTVTGYIKDAVAPVKCTLYVSSKFNFNSIGSFVFTPVLKAGTSDTYEFSLPVDLSLYNPKEYGNHVWIEAERPQGGKFVSNVITVYAESDDPQADSSPKIIEVAVNGVKVENNAVVWNAETLGGSTTKTMAVTATVFGHFDENFMVTTANYGGTVTVTSGSGNTSPDNQVVDCSSITLVVTLGSTGLVEFTMTSKAGTVIKTNFSISADTERLDIENGNSTYSIMALVPLLG